MPPKAKPKVVKAHPNKNSRSPKGKETKKVEKPEVKPEKEVSVEIKTIGLKQMPVVVIEDNSNDIKNSGKCVMIVDAADGMVATFLKYRDTNYLNVLVQRDMDAEIIRQSLLGAIRHGKTMVLDTMDVNRLQTCKDYFDNVRKGLLAEILDKSLVNNETYLGLIKSTDEYNELNYPAEMAANFRFLMITTTSATHSGDLEKDTRDACYLVRVTN